MWRNTLIVLLGQLPLAAVAVAPSPASRWALAAGWAAIQMFLISQLLGPRAELFAPAVWRAAPQPRVALTFDDGPHAQDTPAILEILHAARVRATFFFVGERARRHPELVRRAAREGHEIGVHSDTHPWWFSLALPARVRREVSRAADTMESLSGRHPAHFRPPIGHKSLFLRRELEARGLTLVTWSSRGLDTMGRSPRAIHERILATADPGGIVLLHEGARRAPDGTSPTVTALPGLIQALRARGLEPVSLEDLRRDREEPSPRRAVADGAAAGARSAGSPPGAAGSPD